jgi:hypothetical protein
MAHRGNERKVANMSIERCKSETIPDVKAFSGKDQTVIGST